MAAVQAQRHELFAVAAPGLERAVGAELRALRLGDLQEVQGGVTWRGSLEDALLANLWLRSASRVLVRLGRFDAPGRRELLARARRLDLSPFLPSGPVHVNVTCQKSRLYHTGLVAEVVREALKLETPPADTPAPILFVRIVEDRCTLSLDTSGELLHRRGWRRDVSRAPLRESLAAALLLLSGWNGGEPLLDPMCGSGTIVIEAALLATGRAPGAHRSFAVERFPALDTTRAQTLRDTARSASRPVPGLLLMGTDIHAGALHAARGNAQRAGVDDLVRFERQDVARLVPPAPTGLVLTNPPYGHRLLRQRGGQGADGLAALATGLKGGLQHWNRFIFGPGVELRRTLRLPVVRAVRLENGGIPVELIQLRPTPGGVESMPPLPVITAAE